MLNRLAIASFSAVLALSTYACGDDDDDDDTGDTPDAAADDGSDGPDAGSDVDAAVGPRDPAITDLEGGQLLVEYIYLDQDLSDGIAGGAPTVNRNMGFFMSGQTPEANALPLVSATETCVNLYETDGWPLGPYDGQDRDEVDVGEVTISGVNTAGDEVTTVVPTGTTPIDNWQRPHDLFYEFIPQNAENFLQPDSTYTVSMSGSDEYPATTYEDAIYIAGTFELGTPGLDDEDIGLSTTSDTLITWDPPTVPNENQPDDLFGGALLTVVVLGDANTGAPVMLCPVPAAQGEFTITAEQVASFRASVIERAGGVATAADRAILLRNNFSHIIRWFNNGTDGAPYDPANPRRIDFLGVNCWAQVVNSPE